MSGMTSGALARLAFWAKGMTAIRDGIWNGRAFPTPKSSGRA